MGSQDQETDVLSYHIFPARICRMSAGIAGPMDGEDSCLLIRMKGSFPHEQRGERAVVVNQL